MARFLFFCLSNSLAHAARVVRLARALKGRGHDCVLAGSPGFFADPQVVAPGELAVETLWEPDLEEVLAVARGIPPKTAEHVRFQRMMSDERVLLDRVRPDVVVTDNRRTVLLTAEVKKIPSLSLTAASMLGPHCALEPRLDSLANICGPVMGGTPQQVRASPTYAGLTPLDPVALPSAPLGAAVEKVIRTQGARRREFVHQLCFGDRTLIVDPPALVPTRDLPAGARQVGPIFPELAVAPPPWWDKIDPARPLVYLTFGSTGRAGFAEALAQLTRAKMQCVVSTAHLEDARSVKGVLAARYLPAEILSRAQVVVCHGGTQTVYQALAAGTPVLTLPSHMETALTAIAVVEKGVGACLPGASDASKLVGAIESLLADGALRSRVSALKIDAAAGLAAAVETAESLVKAR